jgi:hypothetical protein
MLRIALGILGLLAGIMVYIADRSPASIYFLANYPDLLPHLPVLFGSLGGSLPTFLHPFSFVLITAGVLGHCTGVQLRAVSLGWFSIDSVLELAQHPAVASRLAGLVPSWFDRFPVLDNARNYLLHGTFDPRDLVSIALGALSAYLICSLLLTGRRNNNDPNHPLSRAWVRRFSRSSVHYR